MSTAILPTKSEYPHVTKPENGPAFLTRHPRWRIAMIVAEHLAWGWSAEEIQRNHSYATLSEIHSALAYYYDHHAEIDSELDDEARQVEEFSNRPEQVALRQKMKARMAAKVIRSDG